MLRIWADAPASTARDSSGYHARTRGCAASAVFRTAPDQVHATGGTCPHKDGPLVEGIVHAHKVTCPLHNMVFDLTTGLAVGEDHSIPVYPVEIRDGRVMLDLAARPLAAAE